MRGDQYKGRDRRPRLARLGSLGLVAFATGAPVLAVTIIPWLARWTEVLDPVLRGEPNDERTLAAYTDVLAGISSDLGTMAVAVIAGTAAIAGTGSPKWMTWRHLVVATCAVLLAIASYYAGIRFRFAIAEQIIASTLDFDRITDRLATQGFSLIIAVSMLLNLAVRRFVSSPRDQA